MVINDALYKKITQEIDKKRVVICHYHIFKNSGTTFDTLLSQNYGDRHISFDGPFPYFVIEQDQLERIIMNNAGVIAFSSHQVRLPIPTSLDFVVIPVVFIRHPLLRIRSIYQFKGKADDGTPMSKAALALSFDQWIDHCFSDSRLLGNISNAQTGILSGVYQRKRLLLETTEMKEYDIHQTIRNIENVQLLGRTEFFDEDVQRFPEILAKYRVEFNYKKIKPENVTSSDMDKPFEERLDLIRQSLSSKNYNRLLGANAQDIYLFMYTSNLISARNSHP